MAPRAKKTDETGVNGTELGKGALVNQHLAESEGCKCKDTVCVKVKRTHEDAVMPKFGTDFAVGADLVAVDISRSDERYISYNLGLSFEIPVGYGLFLFPRSSVSNTSLTLANAVGVIDPDFRGTVTARFKRTVDSVSNEYSVGDRVVQAVLMEVPKVRYEEVEELSATARGAGGYGSTGA